MDPLRTQEGPLVVFDLSGVDYFGSMFLAVLLRCWKLATAQGGMMVLVGRLRARQGTAPNHLARHGLADLRHPPGGDGGASGRLRMAVGRTAPPAICRCARPVRPAGPQGSAVLKRNAASWKRLTRLSCGPMIKFGRIKTAKIVSLRRTETSSPFAGWSRHGHL